LRVGDNDKLVGTITDRDLVIRGLADGLGGDAKIREVMTRTNKRRSISCPAPELNR
jgi:CBS domain-containing protein